MKNKTIILDGVEYTLIPKPKKVELPAGVDIRFSKSEIKTYFDLEVRGWCSKIYRGSTGETEENPWIVFRRIESEDGSFTWTDWSTGGVTPIKVQAEIVENWYQNYIHGV